MKPNVEQMIELLKGDLRCGGIGLSDLIAGYDLATDEQKKALGLAFLVRYGKELPGYRALWSAWRVEFGAPARFSLGRAADRSFLRSFFAFWKALPMRWSVLVRRELDENGRESRDRLIGSPEVEAESDGQASDMGRATGVPAEMPAIWHLPRGLKDSRHRTAEHGTTLVFTLLIVAALLALTMAGLFASASDLKISSNYQTGLQALLNAQSGIVHAKRTIDQLGVTRFDSDIVANWGSLFGISSIAVSGYPLLSYSVSATTDTTDPTGRMLLTSSGQAPNEAQRFVRAGLALSGAFSPGAVYLPGDSVSPSFNGNKFLVDGNDTNLDGTPHASGTVPGISARNPDAVHSIVAALSPIQYDNVIGAGGIPSVKQASGFTADQLLNGILPAILSSPDVVTDPYLNGSDIFGTPLVPQITHFTGNANITGNLSGVGILVVDQGLTISGSTTFTGLIIVKGTTQITTVQGNMTILGALWTTDLRLAVGGSASVTYSTQALRLVNAMFPSPPLPQHVKLVSWKEA